MSHGKRLCSFQKNWLDREEFSSWLKAVHSNKYLAACTLCGKSFNIGSMGISALVSHAKGRQHMSELKTQMDLKDGKNQHKLDAFNFTEQPRQSEAPVTTAASSESEQQTMTSAATFNQAVSPSSANQPTATVTPASKPTASVTSFATKDDVTKAEVVWTLKTVMSHHSFNSGQGLNSLLQAMFPDSEIAKKFQLGPDKMAYMVRFGLSEYFRKELLNDAKMADSFVLAFDEALNKASQHGQMDVYIRFWDCKSNRVTSRYLGSAFLGHATADDLVNHFLASVEGLDLRRLSQVSMDGPKVNLAFLEKLKQKLAPDPQDAVVLDLGTCGLHIVHGAFQTGAKASDFDINHLLTSLYYLFHDSPARRQDYTTITSSEVFPKKFCAHRWIENGPVAARALEIWNNVKKFVSSIKKKPDTRSFDVVKASAEDPLTAARLAFFISVADHVKHFLTMFQGDRPLFPFLGDELGNIIRTLMNRFIKREVIAAADTVWKLTKIDCTDKKNHTDYKHVDVGFAADQVLRQAPSSVSDLQKMVFRTGCCKFLAAMTAKLLERCPLKYGLVRYLNCLAPKRLATSPEECSKAFKEVLKSLLTKRHFSANQCDEAGRQFSNFCDEVVKQRPSEFMNFAEAGCSGKDADRLDELFAHHMATNSDYAVAWKVIKFCLILSHGQAFVESGFSVNKDMIVENQLEESLVARRLVYHGVKNAGNFQN